MHYINSASENYLKFNVIESMTLYIIKLNLSRTAEYSQDVALMVIH